MVEPWLPGAPGYESSQGSIGVGGKEFLNPLGMSAWDKYWMLTIG